MLRFDFQDLGAVSRRWWRWRRGQLVGEKAPIVSSVSVSTGSTGVGLGTMPRGRVTKLWTEVCLGELDLSGMEAARSLRARGVAKGRDAKDEAERERAWDFRRTWTGRGCGN